MDVNQRSSYTVLLWLLIATPIVIHFYLLYCYAVNAPRLDDFSEILTFLPDWHAAASTQEKMAVFFRDYQNHRYIFYHALLVIFDHINFRSAAITGNLPLVMICGALMVITKDHPQKKVIWLITPFLLFNLQSWRAMFWGPLGTSNLFYPCIALLTCRLATFNTLGIFCAGVMTAFLMLAHGSGPILLPVIAAYLWAASDTGHHKKSIFIYWVIFSLIALTLYFVVYPLHSEAGYSSHSSIELLQTFYLKASAVIQGFFALLGSVMLYNDATQAWKYQLAISIGILECGWLGWLITRGTLQNYPALLMWLVFLLLTTLSIASGRVAYAGIDQAMQGHYKLLNGILVWFVIVATLDFFNTQSPKEKIALPIAAIALALFLYGCGWFLFLSPLKSFQAALLHDVQQWQTSEKLKETETVLYVKQPNKKLKAAIDGGFYNPNDQH